MSERLTELEDAFARVEAARNDVVNIVNEHLGPLLASAPTPHAGKRRAISVAVTEIETGCLWLANARASIAEDLREERAKREKKGAVEDERYGDQ